MIYNIITFTGKQNQYNYTEQFQKISNYEPVGNQNILVM